jgi:uncharacterized protein (TIGR00661 family)
MNTREPRRLRVLFVINGDGRGHMTQAIAVADHLRSAGHSIVHAVVGESSRGIPLFFNRRIGASLSLIPNPELLRDSCNRSVTLLRSFRHNLKLAGEHRAGVEEIHRLVELHEPDVILNFYHILAGLYSLFYRPQTPMISVGHQYLVRHPGFILPRSRRIDRAMLKLFTRITAGRSERLLALSFYPLPDAAGANVFTVPPFLRRELFEFEDTEQQEILLVYVLNDGYLRDVVDWYDRQDGLEVHCFVENPRADQLRNGLNVHELDDTSFLDLMARCRAVVCTAGFETICEAHYLNKPTLAVPVEGHFEQQVNAWDAERAGAATFDTAFDIDRFLEDSGATARRSDGFRAWAREAAGKVLHHIEAVG